MVAVAIPAFSQTSAVLTSDDRLYSPAYEENRLSVQVSDVADPMLRCVLAVEDRRFFWHPGVDWRAVARAAYVNVRCQRFVQGGSTITQQLVRSAILRRSDRTVRRKILEAFLAVLLERQMTKRRILEAYLNAVYFGHNVYGVQLAALTFCGKLPSELEVSDAAYLAGLLKAPARYCRCCNPVRAHDRWNLVMRLAGVTFTQSPTARRWKRRSACVDLLPLTGAYVTEYVRRWLRQTVPSRYPSTPLIVHSTIDSRCQLAVEEACAATHRTGYSGRMAVIVQDAQTSSIKGMAGGVEFRRHNFNAAVAGNLQPGSVLKPFVLLAALQAGLSLDLRYTSRPLEIKLPNGTVWRVRNAREQYRGSITVADALVCSDNTVYAQLLLDVGLDRVRKLLTLVGIPCDGITPAISVGAIRPGLSPISVSTAYSVFSARGFYFQASIVSQVTDERGAVVAEPTVVPTPVCSTAHSDAVASVLKQVNEFGTGGLFLPRTGLASKTGTSVSGGWHVSFDETFRVLTWTEFDFLPAGVGSYAGKGVSAKALASRVWQLLGKQRFGFSETYGIFSGVDRMSVRDLLWVEDSFQQT